MFYNTYFFFKTNPKVLVLNYIRAALLLKYVINYHIYDDKDQAGDWLENRERHMQ